MGANGARGDRKRGRLENGLTHSEPTLAESEKADVRSFLNEMLRLMPVMGVHFFEPAKSIAVAPILPAATTPRTSPEVIVVLHDRRDSSGPISGKMGGGRSELRPSIVTT